MNALLPNLPLDALHAVLMIPAAGAALLALLPGYWLAARLNFLIALATLIAALFLLTDRPPPGGYLFVDDLNVTPWIGTRIVEQRARNR